MSDFFGWVNFAFGLIGAIAGVIVLRGIFHRTLSSVSAARFLKWSLVASVAGLMPVTRHLTPVQQICIPAVYCAGAATLAWLKFGLVGRWRRIFALSITAVLYFDVTLLSTWIFRNPPLFTAPLAQPLPFLQLVQILLAVAFMFLATLAVRKCRIEPLKGAMSGRSRAHI